MNGENIIPKITDKRGMSWNQPHRRYIEIDEEYALMTKQTFEGLREYSLTIPSGKYEGKMWKANKGCAFNNSKNYYCKDTHCIDVDRKDDIDVIYKKVKRS